MAILSSQQVLEILKKGHGRNQEEIKEAIRHDKRAVFHTEPYDQEDQVPYLADYLEWVKKIIDKDKYSVFRHLLMLPVDTVDFTEGVFNELKKVFKAQDRFIHHSFTNQELANDFNEFLEEIGDEDFWKTKGFEAMKSAVNSILIVDVPRLQINDRPEPYYYLLEIKKVKAVECDDNQNIEWIVFEDPVFTDLVHAFDEASFKTFMKNDSETFELINEVPHDIGYTPARFFWSTPFNSKSKIRKRGPITNALSRLDWLLMKYQLEKHETLRAGMPIDIMYEQKCNYHDDDGDICEDGWVNKIVKLGHGVPTETKTVRSPCPKCNGNKPTLGAGTLLIAPARGDSADPDMINGLVRIGAEVNTMKWLEESTEAMEQKITWNMIGFVQDQVREAMNEQQVSGNFESRLNVLMSVKDNFEKIHSFALNTLGIIRYGNGVFLGSTVNYGEKMHIHTIRQLNANLKEAKENGMPVYEITNQQRQILSTKYQNNPEMQERIKILSNIEPFQGLNNKDLIELNNAFGLPQELVELKLNFNYFVDRFEREFMNIVTFMQFTDFDEKIEFIQTKLLDYAKESNQAGSRSDTQTDGGLAPETNSGGSEDGSGQQQPEDQ